MDQQKLKAFLDRKVAEYNRPSFIALDPVCIPHLFTRKQDIEIAGFFASIFAWGNRTTIINKTRELMMLMENSPHQFITQHHETDLKRMLHFKHRTFNVTDLLYFIHFLKYHYAGSSSLQSAFTKHMNGGDETVEAALRGFQHYFFLTPDAPQRTRKHIATPDRNSTCKRLNMYLRWMVRRDGNGVDFGIWKNIRPHQLVCPVDVHVARVAKGLGLVHRKQVDWLTALELTAALKRFDADDPVKYDFALFSLGIGERF